MRKLLTAALLAASILANAAPAVAVSQATAAQHHDLAEALVDAGITLYLDAELCRLNPQHDGFYHSPSRSLVVCNEGSSNMTENSLDTLRHEAIHVVQDCKGVLGDQVLDNVLKPGVVRELAARHGVDLGLIREIYSQNGADARVISLEYEAFVAAAAMPASTIASAVRITCEAR